MNNLTLTVNLSYLYKSNVVRTLVEFHIEAKLQKRYRKYAKILTHTYSKYYWKINKFAYDIFYATTLLSKICLLLTPDFVFATFVGDLEWDVSEVETEATDVAMDDNMLMLGEGTENPEPSRDLIIFSPNTSSRSESPTTESAPQSTPLALPPSISVTMEVDRITTMALPNDYMPYQGELFLCF